MRGELVTDCPRCGAKQITFDVIAHHLRGIKYQWQSGYEVFSVCRNCDKPTAFFVSLLQNTKDPLNPKSGGTFDGSLNNYFKVEGFISLKNFRQEQPPEHVPADIKSVFTEGATCLAVECFNAAGTMFRLCIDMATRRLLPEKDRDGLNPNIRRSLGLRIRWLLDQKLLTESLRDLSTCIREDGNDGAHAGTLDKPEAQDLLDFTTLLLERLYTEPERLRLAEERRNARRKPVSTGKAVKS